MQNVDTLLRVYVCSHCTKKYKAKRMRLRHRVQCTELRVHWPQKQGKPTHTHTRTHLENQLAWSHLVVSSLTSKRITDNRHTHRHTRTYNTCSSQPLRARAQVCDLLDTCYLACSTVSAIARYVSGSFRRMLRAY